MSLSVSCHFLYHIIGCDFDIHMMKKGFSDFPVFYSPLLQHGKCNSNKSINKKIKRKKINVLDMNYSNPRAQLIKGPPTYTFNVLNINKSKKELLNDNPVYDEKIRCTTDLLLYPELMIAKQMMIPHNTNDFSFFSNIPSSDNSENIHCICHKKQKKLAMAMCSLCNRWSHLYCYNINEEKIPDVFVCIYCQYHLVFNIKRQVDNSLGNIRKLLDDLYVSYVSIEERAIKNSKDRMIQINCISHLNEIHSKLIKYIKYLHKTWNKIYDSYTAIDNIMASFIWDQNEEEMDGNEEESEDKGSDTNDEN